MPEFPQTNTGFPTQRPRRLRHDEFSRRLVRENRLTSDDLIYPCFVIEGKGISQAVPSMPGGGRRRTAE